MQLVHDALRLRLQPIRQLDADALGLLAYDDSCGAVELEVIGDLGVVVWRGHYGEMTPFSINRFALFMVSAAPD